MTKIGLITIADFGSISNLKSNESFYVYKAIKKIDPDCQIICRDYKDFEHKNIKKAIPLGRITFYIINGIQKYIYKNLPSRKITLRIMDFFTSLKIDKKLDLVYLIPAAFPITTKKLNKLNIKIISHGGSAYPKFNSELKSRLLKKQTTWANSKEIEETLNRSDYIFALSKFVKLNYIKYNIKEEKIYITELGTQIKNINKKPHKKFTILCVANYDILKGYQYLLEAWSRLKLKNAELIILGNPSKEMKPIIEKYKKKLKNFKQINFANPEIYYNKSTVFIHPSLTEGSAKVIFEAMSYSLPIICTLESGSIIQNNKEGFLIKSSNTKDLEDKIMFFYNNSSEIKKMGNQAKLKIQKKYKWEDYTNRVYNSFKKIIKKNNL